MNLALVEPLLIGMRLCEFRLDFLVGDDAALLKVNEQHLARLQSPFLDDAFLRCHEHACLRRHDNEVVARDEVARRAQAVAVQRGADLQAVGEGHAGRAVPRLHEGGVILVEGAPLVVHQRVAGPRFRDQHHRRVRERVAALHQEFERVVETGRVRLAFIGDRPELGNVVAEQRG